MTSSPTTRGRFTALALATGFLALTELGLAGVAATIWNTRGNGATADVEAAPFALAGVSAVVGAFATLVIMIAFIQGIRGHGTAGFAVTLAWLRVAAVVAGLAVLALRFGSSALLGTFPTTGVVIALADALVGLLIARAAARRTRPTP